MQHLQLMIYWRHEESCPSSQKGREKVTTGSKRAPLNFHSSAWEWCLEQDAGGWSWWWGVNHSTVQTLGWPLQTRPQKWWNPPETLWRIYILHLFPPKNDHGPLKIQQTLPVLTSQLPKGKKKKQKKPKCPRRLRSGPGFDGECLHLLRCLVCLVCHNQSILWVVTRSWIIDSCRQLACLCNSRLGEASHSWVLRHSWRWRQIFPPFVYSSPWECWRGNAAICICLVPRSHCVCVKRVRSKVGFLRSVRC